MNGLAKIAMNENIRKEIEEAFTPQRHEEVTINNKPQVARDLGITGSLMGGAAGLLATKKPLGALIGAGIGAGVGAGLGYGAGYEYTDNRPVYTDEQEWKQLELLERYPRETSRYANELNRYGLAKIADTSSQLTTNDTVYRYLKKTYPEDSIQWAKMVSWKLRRNVPLEQIKMGRRPGGAREMDKVKGIAQAIKEGKAMEPVVLVKTRDGVYKIADGFHRTLGFKQAGKKTIKAWVTEVPAKDGPWDREMHEKKLNVGKK